MSVQSPSDRKPGPRGNLPGTEVAGIIFLEYVDVERKSGGVWSQIAGRVPATFEPVPVHSRQTLETWSHKPLLCLWIMPDTPLADADRVIRDDGSHWYIRGAPLLAPMKTHIVALAERASEDALFATRSAQEPS